MPVEAENQALISGLKSVPTGTSLPGGKAAEKELSRQWQEDRLRERLDAAEEELCWREQQARTVWEMQMRAFCEGGSTDGLEEESRRIREMLSGFMICPDNPSAFECSPTVHPTTVYIPAG